MKAQYWRIPQRFKKVIFFLIDYKKSRMDTKQ